MHDNIRTLIANMVQNYLKEAIVRFLEWPRHKSDKACLGPYWVSLQDRQVPLRKLEELEVAVTEGWYLPVESKL